MTPTHPPAGIPVLVQWHGRELRCARTFDKNTGAPRWVSFEGGELVNLPPKRQRERWGDEPDCWRPQEPDKWDAPLPPPCAHAEPRMVYRTGRNRYSAMAAQAEQSARTQAELRKFVDEVMGAEPEAAHGTWDHQWWMVEPLTYSDAGEISVREAEGRVARAILTDGIRTRYGGPSPHAGTSSALQQFVHEVMQSEDADAVPRFEPSGRDNDDYLTAFAWFNALNPPGLWHKRRDRWELSQAQYVLVARVLIPPRSWRQIARITGGSHENARKVYGSALAGVHRAANGEPVTPFVSGRDAMAALRESNRRWKRQQEGE